MTEREIFERAVEIADPNERAAFLDRACADRPEARAPVEQLLRAHELAGGFLDRPHPAAGEGTGAYLSEAPPGESAGTVIAARYKLLQQIGEGGMGSVWMADQLEPVKRRVAVKLIRAERDGSRAVLSRFGAERQAIALMDHPNIAKLLEAGTMGSRPFFVMELVKGTPLTEYCDQHRLSVTDRLKLFAQICSAVQHAHQKGIIHRDLKPSNILVESHDGKPVPKVIDFGLAKALSGQPLTEQTMFTGFGTIAGTPLYMAPEQAAFNAIDVDTRADIYALGVILYELLTGTTPIERETFKKAALEEMLRVIREQEPPTPSKRLSSTESRPVVAANRQSEPARLGRFVRGELDWIVMKALSKERDRRYDTANGLAKDIERFLNHEAVQAAPPSAGYRLRKFLQRNKGAVAATAVVALTFVGGMIGTTWGMVVADGHRKTAEIKEGQATAAAAEEGRAHQREAEERRRAIRSQGSAVEALRAMTDDVIERLIGAQPSLGPNERAFLEAALKRWQRFANELGDTPEARSIRSEATYRVAGIQAMLGARSEAVEGFNQSIHLSTALVETFPEEPTYKRQAAAGHDRLGVLLKELGKWTEAEQELVEACRLTDQLAENHPGNHEYQVIRATARADFGRYLGLRRRFKEAETNLRLALSIEEPLVAEFQSESKLRRSIAANRGALGITLRDQRQLPKAEAELRQSLKILEELVTQFAAEPINHRQLASTHNMLGIVLAEQGKRKDAEASFRASLALRERFAAQFPAIIAYKIEIGECYRNLGGFFMMGGNLAQSQENFGRAIAQLSPLVESDDMPEQARQHLSESYWGRASILHRLGRFPEAMPDWDKAVALSTNAQKPTRRAARAGTLIQVGRLAEAVAEINELIGNDNWVAGDWYNFACAFSLASAKDVANRDKYGARAIELLRRAVEKGWTDAKHIKEDKDLDPLRDRDDFKKLVETLAKPNK